MLKMLVGIFFDVSRVDILHGTGFVPLDGIHDEGEWPQQLDQRHRRISVAQSFEQVSIYWSPFFLQSFNRLNICFSLVKIYFYNSLNSYFNFFKTR